LKGVPGWIDAFADTSDAATWARAGVGRAAAKERQGGEGGEDALHGMGEPAA